MNDAAFVRGGQGVGDLAGNFDCLIDWQRPPLQLLLERLAIDQFHDDAGGAIHLFEPVNLSDVRVVQ
jgi:hypothetical protein